MKMRHLVVPLATSLGLLIPAVHPAPAAALENAPVTRISMTVVTEQLDPAGHVLAGHSTSVHAEGAHARLHVHGNANLVLTPDYGTPSASGGARITVFVAARNIYGTMWRWNTELDFCWGGGVSGVHWGYVYRCGFAPGSIDSPTGQSYFSNINGYFVDSAEPYYANAYYTTWPAVGNPYHSAFVDYQKGAAHGSFPGYSVSYWPSDRIEAYLNGTYDASGSL